MHFKLNHATILSLLLTACIASASAEQATNKMYLKFDVGPAFISSVPISSPANTFNYEAEFDVGIRSTVAFGYQINRNWACELETGVIWSSDTAFNDDFYQIPALLNVIYRVPTGSSWTPYLGVGVGGVATTFSTLVFQNSVIGPVNAKETNFTFAYQAGAGVEYVFSPTMTLNLGYKFLGAMEQSWSKTLYPPQVPPPNTSETYTSTADGVFSHAVLVSFTWSF